uniref:D-lactate dehydrogenase (cytochrome) n=1 Tax=Compsopogon caeruleus TaxID=31354 RepID=A0A7S1XGK8_9RHOD
MPWYSSSSVEEQVLRLQSEVESCHGTRYAYSTKEEEAEILWTARKEAYWSAYSLVPNREIWTTDVCVPISAMAEIVEATKKELGEAGIVAPLVAHLGDGNFHFLMLLNSTDAEELQRATLCNDRMVRRAIELGGTCTGEHGVGEGKKQFLEVEYGVEALAMMKALKTLFDPNNIMNPGKIVDLESDRD